MIGPRSPSAGALGAGAPVRERRPDREEAAASPAAAQSAAAAPVPAPGISGCTDPGARAGSAHPRMLGLRAVGTIVSTRTVRRRPAKAGGAT